MRYRYPLSCQPPAVRRPHLILSSRPDLPDRINLQPVHRMIDASAQFGHQANRDQLDSEDQEEHAQEQRTQVFIDGHAIKHLEDSDTSQKQETCAGHTQPPESKELKWSLQIVNEEFHRQ